MVSAITGNQSVSTWRGAKSLFVPCDIKVWKGLHHRFRCMWGGWREKTWTATWCPSHQLHPPLIWNHQSWNKALCRCCWMRTFVLPDVLHELPAALLLYAKSNRKVSILRGESGSHGSPYESMANGACPAPIHLHSGWSVAIAKMPLDSCMVFGELQHNGVEVCV